MNDLKNQKNKNDFLDAHQFGQRRILQYDVNEEIKLIDCARESYQKGNSTKLSTFMSI